MKTKKEIEETEFEQIINRCHSLTEKIDTGDFQKYISFRNFFNISKEGGVFTQIIDGKIESIPRDVWERGLLTDEQKNEQFQIHVRELASDIGVTDNELSSFEDFLITGIISYQKSSMRVKTEINKKTGEREIWLRIDGLSLTEITEELEMIKQFNPNTIKTDYKPTRTANYMLHKKIYDMYSKGMKPREIVMKLTNEVYQAQEILKTYDSNTPDTIKILSANNVSKMIKRYKDFKEKKRDKLKK